MNGEDNSTPVTHWETELRPLLERLEIISLEEARLGARIVRATDPTVWPLPERVQGTPPLAHRLACLIYEQAYSRRFDPAHVEAPAAFPVADLIGPLLVANVRRARWSPGWQLAGAGTAGALRMQRGEEVREVQPHDAMPVPGAPGLYHLTEPTGSLHAQPGFYWMYGEENGASLPDGLLCRIYFAASAQGVPSLLRALTAALNAAHLPFQMKALTMSAGYRRRDSVVLMFSRRLKDLVLSVIAQVLAAGDVRSTLGESAPLFTLDLLPGVGLAEDPGRGESFGMHRCHTVAEGIWNAYAAGRQGPEDRIAFIKTQMKGRGLDPEALYREPGSEMHYALPEARERVHPQASGRPTGDLVQAAFDIGLRIARDALWIEDRCTWLQDTKELAKGDFRVVCKAAGPELYAGTAGIALFLASLYTHAKEPLLARTARGAARFANARLSELRSNGLYDGRIGVAFALHHVGRTLEDEGLVEDARRIAGDVAAAEPGAAHDVVSGSAGTIMGLLALESAFPDLPLRAAAVRLADHLLRAARPFGPALAWSGPVAGIERAPLCGLAHGAAGISLSLSEVFHRTRNEVYRRGALGGFAYERMYFDVSVGTWPDLRDLSSLMPAGAAPPAGSATAPVVAWCHGAAGGALSRFRAAHLLGEPHLLMEARLAADAALRALGSTPTGDASYCHGRAGLAEVQLTAATVLSEPWRRDTALALARRTLAIHAQTDLPWSCGVPNGSTVPGLLLGLAGIGAHLLRLHDPSAAPDVLVITG